MLSFRYQSELELKCTTSNAPLSCRPMQTDAVLGKIDTLPLDKSVHEGLGIPYATPPVEDLRFSSSKSVKPWSGIKPATAGFGAPCAYSCYCCYYFFLFCFLFYINYFGSASLPKQKNPIIMILEWLNKTSKLKLRKESRNKMKWKSNS